MHHDASFLSVAQVCAAFSLKYLQAGARKRNIPLQHVRGEKELFGSSQNFSGTLERDLVLVYSDTLITLRVII